MAPSLPGFSMSAARTLFLVATIHVGRCGGTTHVPGSSDTDVPGADTDPAGDTDDASVRDTDDTVPTDTDIALGVGPCAPPDRWTADIDGALYTRTPYPSTYDGGWTEHLRTFSMSGSWSGGHYPITGVTITAIDGDTTFVADGVTTMPLWVSSFGGQPQRKIGDKVSFSVIGGQTLLGVRSLTVNEFVKVSSDNPVWVPDVGTTPVMYDETHLSRVSHLYGEVLRRSSFDCGAGFGCYVVQHDGRTDLVRVLNDNGVGLNPDYAGGLCIEAIGPVGQFKSDTGTAQFVDVRRASWMRAWTKP